MFVIIGYITVFFFVFAPSYQDTTYEIDWFGNMIGDYFGIVVETYYIGTGCWPAVFVWNSHDLQNPLLAVNDTLGMVRPNFYEYVQVTPVASGDAWIQLSYPSSDQFPDTTVFGYLYKP